MAGALTFGASAAQAVPVTISGTAGDDVIKVQADSPASGTYFVNGSGTAFTGATSVTIDAGAGNDSVEFVNPAAGLFAPALGVRFNGGDGTDHFTQKNGTAQRGSLDHDADGAGTQTITHLGESNQKVVLDSVDGWITDWVAESGFTYRATDGVDDVTFGDVGVTGPGRCCGRQYLIVNGKHFDPTNKSSLTVDTKDDGGGQDVVTLQGRWPIAPELVVDDGTREDLVKLSDYTPTGPRDIWLASDIRIRAKRLQDVGTSFYRLEAWSLAVDVEQLDPLNVLVTGLEAVADGDVDLESGYSTETGDIRSRDGSAQVRIWGKLTVPAQSTISAASDVTLTAGSLELQGSASAPAGTVTLRPFGDGQVDLGNVDDGAIAYSPTLNLSDAEIDRVSAQRLQVGDDDSGLITVSAPITAKLPLELVGRGGFTSSAANMLVAPTLGFRDTGSAGRTWTIDGGGVSFAGYPQVRYFPTDRVTFTGGSGADQFLVKASRIASYRIDGGDPSTSPGDTITYRKEGRTVSGDTTPPDGSIESPGPNGVKPVAFGGIEAVSIVP